MKRLFPFLSLCLLLLPYSLRAQTIIKKGNPSAHVVYFLEVDNTSSTSAGKTGLTGQATGTAVALTAGAAGSFTSLQYSTNGGILTNCAGTITEIGKGYYAYLPTSGESNAVFDSLFIAQATGAIDYAAQVAFWQYKPDDIGPQTDKIGTNTADSPNTVTEQSNAATSATQATTAATQATGANTQATTAATQSTTAATQATTAATQATAANAKLLGTIAAQTGDAFLRLGATPPTLAQIIAGLPGTFSLSAGDETILSNLGGTLVGSVFKQTALANSPAAGLTAPQIALLTLASTAQQAGVPVLLPAAPQGYGGPTLLQIETGLLANPLKPLANNAADGTVSIDLSQSLTGLGGWGSVNLLLAFQSAWAVLKAKQTTDLTGAYKTYAPDNATVFDLKALFPLPTVAGSKQ